jgi:HTH-type transcriptional regulator, competence development regulator
MKIERSQAWWLAMADSEGDLPVAAGVPEADALPRAEQPSRVPTSLAATETRLAFGRFINLMRRRRGLSVEQLARKADVDVSELLIIEDDVRHIAEPRTVYQLAQAFGVPQERLVELAGLTEPRDASLREEAVRFAANSRSVKHLTTEEDAALEAFVSVLSQRDLPKGK